MRVREQLVAAPLVVGVGRRGRYSSWKISQICSLVTSPPSASVFACTTRAELDLQLARQVEGVVGLQQVGDAALARLRVDAHDGLVAATQVLRVDRQVRHGPVELGDRDAPAGGLGLHRLEALLDGVLVAIREKAV